MVSFTPQLVALATITTVLTPSVLACLELSGSASSGFDTVGDLTAVDNGVQTCSGSINSGDKNLGKFLPVPSHPIPALWQALTGICLQVCIDGYSLNYDYTDNAVEGPLPITYCNPSNCYGIEIPLDCTEENCCGGTIPCLCYSCKIGYSTFC
ncbi:hypothetical protein BJX99DRAFT_259561 [Aspergillus californicus]